MHSLRDQIIRAIMQGAALSAAATTLSLAACSDDSSTPAPDWNLKDNNTNNANNSVACMDDLNLEVIPNETYPKSIFSDPSGFDRAPPEGRYIVCAAAASLDSEGLSCDAIKGDALYTFIDAALEQSAGCGIFASSPTPETICGPISVNQTDCCYAIDLNFSVCAVGRPFIVDGMVRQADSAAREGWMDGQVSASLTQAVETLDETQRASVAGHWANAGCAEHASIASFSKFLMELLHLGAPRELVEGATRAIRDEIEHAAVCFGIASAYAGRALGPLEVNIKDSLAQSTSAEHILLAVIEEGCIGESLAAVQAQLEASYASHPTIKAQLEKIHRDELEHALLAWRFVGWMLAQRPDLAPLAMESFESHARALGVDILPQGISDSSLALMRHGCTPSYQLQRWRHHAFKHLVEPCAQALFTTKSATQLSI